MTRCGWIQIDVRPINQDGAMLITAMAVLMILLTIFLAALTYAIAGYAYHLRAANTVTAAYLAEAGIQRTLRDVNSRNLFLSPTTRHAPNGGTITTHTAAWGPHILVFSEGAYANQSATATALLGSSPPDCFDAAVTVCDQDHPFVISGNTRIRGDINCGPQGLTTGKIKGEGVTPNEFHIGRYNVFQSLTVPDLDTAVLNRYQVEFRHRRFHIRTTCPGSGTIGEPDNDLLDQGNGFYIENDLLMSNVTLSSTVRIKSVFVGGSVEIGGTSRISGLVEIIAERSISVKDSALLDKVILYAADSIVLAGSSRFSGTAICRGRIAVTEHAALTGPALLLIPANPEVADEPGGLFLSSRGPLEAVCWLASERAGHDSPQPLVYLDSSAVLTGCLISQGDVDLRGVLHGSVVTRRFRYYVPPTTYINWVRNCYVNRAGLRYSPALPIVDMRHSNGTFRILREDGHI